MEQVTDCYGGALFDEPSKQCTLQTSGSYVYLMYFNKDAESNTYGAFGIQIDGAVLQAQADFNLTEDSPEVYFGDSNDVYFAYNNFTVESFWDGDCSKFDTITVDYPLEASTDTDYQSKPVELTAGINITSTGVLECSWILSAEVLETGDAYDSVWISVNDFGLIDGSFNVYTGANSSDKSACVYGDACGISALSNSYIKTDSSVASVVLSLNVTHSDLGYFKNQLLGLNFSFQGHACADPLCNSHGTCYQGECSCDSGWRGGACTNEIPDGWVCEVSHYNASDGLCDCSCQAYDLDCDDLPGITEGIKTCNTTLTQEPGQEWLDGIISYLDFCTFCPVPQHFYSTEEYPSSNLFNACNETFGCDATENKYCDDDTGLCIVPYDTIDDHGESGVKYFSACGADGDCSGPLGCTTDGFCGNVSSTGESISTVYTLTNKGLSCEFPFEYAKTSVTEESCICDDKYGFNFSHAVQQAKHEIEAQLASNCTFIGDSCEYISPSYGIVNLEGYTVRDCDMVYFTVTQESYTSFKLDLYDSDGNLAADGISSETVILNVNSSDSTVNAVACLKSGAYNMSVIAGYSSSGNSSYWDGSGRFLSTSSWSSSSGTSSAGYLGMLYVEGMTSMQAAIDTELYTNGNINFYVCTGEYLQLFSELYSGEYNGSSTPTFKLFSDEAAAIEVDLWGQSMSGNADMGSSDSKLFCVASNTQYSLIIDNVEPVSDSEVIWYYTVSTTYLYDTETYLDGYLSGEGETYANMASIVLGRDPDCSGVTAHFLMDWSNADSYDSEAMGFQIYNSDDNDNYDLNGVRMEGNPTSYNPSVKTFCLSDDVEYYFAMSGYGEYGWDGGTTDLLLYAVSYLDFSNYFETEEMNDEDSFYLDQDYITLAVKFDEIDYPSEVSFRLVNETGSVATDIYGEILAASVLNGTYYASGVYEILFEVDGENAYFLQIYDSFGDGFGDSGVCTVEWWGSDEFEHLVESISMKDGYFVSVPLNLGFATNAAFSFDSHFKKSSESWSVSKISSCENFNGCGCNCNGNGFNLSVAMDLAETYLGIVGPFSSLQEPYAYCNFFNESGTTAIASLSYNISDGMFVAYYTLASDGGWIIDRIDTGEHYGESCIEDEVDTECVVTSFSKPAFMCFTDSDFTEYGECVDYPTEQCTSTPGTPYTARSGKIYPTITFGEMSCGILIQPQLPNQLKGLSYLKVNLTTLTKTFDHYTLHMFVYSGTNDSGRMLEGIFRNSSYASVQDPYTFTTDPDDAAAIFINMALEDVDDTKYLGLLGGIFGSFTLEYNVTLNDMKVKQFCEFDYCLDNEQGILFLNPSVQNSSILTTWSLSFQSVDAIWLDFIKFNIETSEILNIYDGDSNSSPLLVSLHADWFQQIAGNALSFDASLYQFATLPVDQYPSTIMMWVKITSFGSEGALLLLEHGGNTKYGITTEGYLYISWYGELMYCSTQLSTEQWYHITIQRNLKLFQFFIDGELCSSCSSIDSGSCSEASNLAQNFDDAVSESFFYLGSDGGSSYDHELAVDEVSLYSSQISHNEILEVYSNGSLWCDATNPHLMGCYHFDDTCNQEPGIPVTDESMYAMHGKIFGATCISGPTVNTMTTTTFASSSGQLLLELSSSAGRSLTTEMLAVYQTVNCSCSEHGRCERGSCVCDSGWGGEFCDEWRVAQACQTLSTGLFGREIDYGDTAFLAIVNQEFASWRLNLYPSINVNHTLPSLLNCSWIISKDRAVISLDFSSLNKLFQNFTVDASFRAGIEIYGDVLSGEHRTLIYSNDDWFEILDQSILDIESQYGEMEVRFHISGQSFCSDHCMQGIYFNYVAHETLFVAPNEDFPTVAFDLLGTATNPYTSIRTAINNATKNAIIYLYPGRYTDVAGLVISTPVRLEGISGSQFTAIVPTDDSSSDELDGVMAIEAYGTVEMIGLSFLNTIGDSHTMFLQMLIGDVRFTDCHFVSNQFEAGTIKVYHSATLTVRESNFEGNNGGPAIYVLSTKLDVKSSSFKSNIADNNGGAILMETHGAVQVWVEIYSSTFEANGAAQNGGAIYTSYTTVSSAWLYVQESQFSSNSASKGGALYILDTSTVILKECIFESNIAVYYGGAIYVYYATVSTLSTDGVTFSNNSCGVYGGDSIYATGTQVFISKGRFQKHFGDEAVVLYLLSASATIVDTVFEEASVYNIILGSSLTITINNTFFLNFSGTALSLSKTNLQMANSGVIGKTGGENAAVKVKSSSVANISRSNFKSCISTDEAGAIAFENSVLNIDDCIFSNNTGIDGGAIVGTYATLALSRNVFSNNYANGNGGGILIDECSTTMNGDIFIDNAAASDGGAIYSMSSTLNISDASMIGNKAVYGGGMEVSSGYAECIDCYFVSCYASRGGGAAGASDSAIFIVDGGRVENCESEFGGGFNFESEAKPTLKGALVLYNNVATYGGGFFMVRIVSPPSALIKDKVIFQNGSADIGAVGYIAISSGLELDGIAAFYNHAAQGGGGLAIMGAEVTLVNSKFDSCWAITRGGSLYIMNGALISRNNIFHSSIAKSGDGGGAYLYQVLFDVDSTTFSMCSSLDGYGGGVYSLSSVLVFNNSIIEQCSAGENGGAIYSIDDTSYRLMNISMYNNSAVDGGGAYMSAVQWAEILYSNFIGNSASSGGGLYMISSTFANISFTDFLSNEAGCCNDSDAYGGGATIQSVDLVEIYQCAFTLNKGNYGGGLHTDSSTVRLRSLVFNKDLAYAGAGWYSGADPSRRRRLTYSTEVSFRNCMFTSNTALDGGGALYWSSIEPDGVESESNSYAGNKAAYGAITAAPASDLLLNTTNLTWQTSGSTLDVITILVIDKYGNVVSSQNTGTVTASSYRPTADASVSSTTTVEIVNGQAIFDALTATFLPNSTMIIEFVTSLNDDVAVYLPVTFRPCIRGEILTSGSSKCTPCEYGYFSWEPGESSCHDCPTGAVCYGQNGDEIKALRNYWRFENTTGVCDTDDYDDCEFYECEYSGACLGDVWLDDDGTDIACDKGSCILTTTSSKMDEKIAYYCDTDDSGFYEDCILFAKGYFFRVNGTADNISSYSISAAIETTESSLTLSNADLYLVQDEECSEEYVGNACQRCASDYGRGNLGTCVECKNFLLSCIVLFGGIVGVAVYGTIMIWLQMDKENADNEKLSIMIKIFSSYMQLVSVFAEFDFSWPSAILELFAGEEIVSSAGDKIIQLDCVFNELTGTSGSTTIPIFYMKLVFFCLLPICAVLFSVFFWRGCFYWKKWQLHRHPFYQRFLEAQERFRDSPMVQMDGADKHLKKELEKLQMLNDVAEDGMIEADELELVLTALGEKTSQMRINDIMRLSGMQGKEGMVDVRDFQETYLMVYSKIMEGNTILSVVVLLFMLYTNVSTYVFQLFTCTYLDSTRSFLEQDLMTECYTKDHYAWMYALGLPGVLFYIIGIPLFGFYLLHKNRFDFDEDHIKLRYGFLYDGYERKYYFWEMWVMLRKIAVVFCTVFVSRVGEMSEALSGCIVVLFANILHLECQPYEDDTLDSLESYSLYATLMTLLAGLFFYSGEIGYVGTQILMVFIFLVNTVFVLYFAFLAYHDFKLKLINEFITRSAQLQRINDRILKKKTKDQIAVETERHEHEAMVREALTDILSLEEEIALLKGERKYFEKQIENRIVLAKEFQEVLNEKKKKYKAISSSPENLREAPLVSGDKFAPAASAIDKGSLNRSNAPQTMLPMNRSKSQSRSTASNSAAIFELYKKTNRQQQIQEYIGAKRNKMSGLTLSAEKRGKQEKAAGAILDMNEIRKRRESNGGQYYSRSESKSGSESKPAFSQDLLK